MRRGPLRFIPLARPGLRAGARSRGRVLPARRRPRARLVRLLGRRLPRRVGAVGRSAPCTTTASPARRSRCCASIPSAARAAVAPACAATTSPSRSGPAWRWRWSGRFRGSRRRMRLMIAVSDHVARRVARSGRRPRPAPRGPELHRPAPGGRRRCWSLPPRARNRRSSSSARRPRTRDARCLLEAFRSLRDRGLDLNLAGGDGTFAAQAVSDLGRRPEVRARRPLPRRPPAGRPLRLARPLPDRCPGGDGLGPAGDRFRDRRLDRDRRGRSHRPPGSSPRTRLRCCERSPCCSTTPSCASGSGRRARGAVGRFSSDAVLPELEAIYCRGGRIGTGPMNERGPDAGERLRRRPS